MTWTMTVENIKCGGCAKSITKALMVISGVSHASVDIENGDIRIDGDEGLRGAVTQRLLELGYPESGSISGFGSVTAKAKSFVSCAIGRMS